MNLSDLNIRLAAFTWLKEQSEIYIDGIPRAKLDKGFEYNGERITLTGPRGIWKPKQMQLPISVTTIQNSPYDDNLSEKGFLKYSYRGTDPFHSDNVGLREIMNKRIPLIYFLSIQKGFYIAEWPVYIVRDDVKSLSFTIDLKEENISNELNEQYSSIEKSYGKSQILVRLHQRMFREKVLQAYHNQCSLCKLKHRELLDAAHIISDKQDKGDPIIQNGISLCKIHHAAFDYNIIGISPEYSINVRNDVLKEIDGPMLRFGIQELNNKEIILPERKEFWPDKERLNERFQVFLKAS